MPGCIEVSDNGDVWSLCADTDEEIKAWDCPINTVLNIPCETEDKPKE